MHKLQTFLWPLHNTNHVNIMLPWQRRSPEEGHPPSRPNRPRTKLQGTTVLQIFVFGITGCRTNRAFSSLDYSTFGISKIMRHHNILIYALGTLSILAGLVQSWLVFLLLLATWNFVHYICSLEPTDVNTLPGVLCVVCLDVQERDLFQVTVAVMVT